MALPEYPITDKEKFLAKAAGQDVGNLPEAITREEQYLEAIMQRIQTIEENGGGGGGGGDSDARSATEKEIEDVISDLDGL